MKVLFYNWVPFDDDENRGGGVTIYQRNLISQMVNSGNYEIYFISSGIAYFGNVEKPYIVKTKNIFGRKCKSYLVVNSPMLSPGHASFYDMHIYLNDLSLYKLFREFIQKKGPFDVIHFNNFEGLTLNVLKIKNDFPQTKIIYSLHNYYSFCPQVNLWKKEKKNCQDFHNGNDCLTCLTETINKNDILYADKAAYILKSFHIYSHSPFFKLSFKYLHIFKKFNKAWDILLKRRKKTTEVYNICAESYKMYREKNVAYMNRYVDKILCVSHRVEEIANKMGISEKITATDYIGTVIAETQVGAPCAPIDSKIFTIAFLGYMRKDKGFDFFLRALRQGANKDIAKKMRIIIAAKITDTRKLKHFYKLGKSYYEIEVHDGYTHKELPGLLAKVNLGIVPVLWEDNLPQVAIEMVANGVPILTSDLGGAQELAGKQDFVFQNKNANDFWEKIENLFNDRGKLADFWTNYKPLTRFEDHIKMLEKYYTE